MRQDVTDQAHGATLFRKNAVQSASYRLFGSVTAIVPPSGFVALAVAVLALSLLGLVAWTVEIPQRARAVGVLMPPDGFLDIVAGAPGRAANIVVSEGQAINAGDLLLNIRTDHEQLAVLQLQSLHSEIGLLIEARKHQAAIDASRLLAFDERLDSISKRLGAAKAEVDLQQDQVELFERRLARREGLASNGSLSADALDQERTVLLQARSRREALRHSILGYEQDVAAITRSRREALTEGERGEILHDLELRRLQRQIEEHRHLISREVRATRDGVVARVNVREGATVVAGEPLVKIYRPHQDLEAWLYLSSADAGFLQVGQVVQLRLDAYPYQLFGTSAAVVTSVSSVAIVPREINAPLALTGPVFEVRAKLSEAQIKAFNSIWPLAPGTSFEADLVQHRYKLYEWLLRAVTDRSGDQRA